MQEMQEIQIQSLGQEDPLEKGMATHSSILAWRIPMTEELGELAKLIVPKVINCIAVTLEVRKFLSPLGNF